MRLKKCRLAVKSVLTELKAENSQNWQPFGEILRFSSNNSRQNQDLKKNEFHGKSTFFKTHPHSSLR